VVDDSFAAGRNPGIADAAIFFEGAGGAEWLDTKFGAVLFEEKPVAGAYAESAADFVGDGDLALAGETGLFLQGWFRHSLLYHGIPYFFGLRIDRTPVPFLRAGQEDSIEERSFVAALLWMTANCGWELGRSGGEA
jgi:hypothetical protein